MLNLRKQYSLVPFIILPATSIISHTSYSHISTSGSIVSFYPERGFFCYLSVSFKLGLEPNDDLLHLYQYIFMLAWLCLFTVVTVDDNQHKCVPVQFFFFFQNPRYTVFDSDALHQ